MGIANSTLLASRRQSEDESAVNQVVSSPAPGVASPPTSHAAARSSPIDGEALDDVPASQVRPLRRSRRTRSRRQAVPAVDDQLHAPCQGCKRRRVAAVTDISLETGFQLPPKEPTFTCPVCWEDLDEPATTTCGHIFCTKCIKQAIQAQKRCPTCRKSLKRSSFHRIYFPDTAT